MVPDIALILLTGGFLTALGLSALLLRGPAGVRVYAQPNARSFHRQATPTAGGIAFVVPVIGYLVWLAVQGSPVALALGGVGALLAAVGLWDDVREVSTLVRLIVQFAATSTVAVYVLVDAGLALVAVTALVLAWQVNLYNFMDGIDGLAAVQTLVFAVGAQVVGQGLPGWPGDLLWLLAGTMLGFLVFNWPKARVFMGDVGSYFLGLGTGAVALLLWQQHTLALPVSLILLCGFWFDATYTLIVRMSTGQAFTRPHRTHLYQKVAAKRGHLWTTVCFLLYACFWLMPLSWLCSKYTDGLSFASLIWLLPAVTPLGIAAWRLRAGLPETDATGRAM